MKAGKDGGETGTLGSIGSPTFKSTGTTATTSRGPVLSRENLQRGRRDMPTESGGYDLTEVGRGWLRPGLGLRLQRIINMIILTVIFIMYTIFIAIADILL